MKFWSNKKNKKKELSLNLDFLKRIDSDNDGLTDYEEKFIYGTDPNNPDTDKDGLSDYQEVKMGRNPLGSGKLKKLFIPCEDNNYQPRILHPYRLIFYTISALAVQLIVIVFVLLFPMTAWLTPDLLVQESRKIIELTNEIRQGLSVSMLSEQQLLNQAAYDKAQDMLVRQYFAHVGPDRKDLSSWLYKNGYQYSVAGENLAVGFASAEDVVLAWTKSRTHYANLIDQDFREIGVGMVSGPFNGYETTLVAQYFASGSRTSVAAAQSISLPQSFEVAKEQPPIEVKIQELDQMSHEVDIQEIESIEAEVIPKTESGILTQKEPEIEEIILNETAKQPNQTEELEKAPETIIKKDNFENDNDNKLLKSKEDELSEKKEPEINNQNIVEEKLEPPILISHKNGATIDQREVKLVIWAPKAEEVIVYDNGIEIGRRTAISSEFFDFNFTFKEGSHRLNFKSVAGHLQRLSEDYFININPKDKIIYTDGKLIVLQPKGQQEQIIKAIAYLDNEIIEAWVEFNGYRINLDEVGQTEEGLTQWEGQMVIFDSDKKKIFDIVILPVLTTKNNIGETSFTNIAWENVTPIKPSLIRQYFFIKSNPLKSIDLIFNVESLFYKLILLVAVFSLILDIFIEFKKQNPKIIFSTLGFISLLIILIIV